MVNPWDNRPGGPASSSLRRLRWRASKPLELLRRPQRERKGVKLGEVVKAECPRSVSLWLAQADLSTVRQMVSQMKPTAAPATMSVNPVTRQVEGADPDQSDPKGGSSRAAGAGGDNAFERIAHIRNKHPPPRPQWPLGKPAATQPPPTGRGAGRESNRGIPTIDRSKDSADTNTPARSDRFQASFRLRTARSHHQQSRDPVPLT